MMRDTHAHSVQMTRPQGACSVISAFVQVLGRDLRAKVPLVRAISRTTDCAMSFGHEVVKDKH